MGVVEDVQQVLLQTASSVQSEAIYTPMAQAPTRCSFVTLRSRGGDPGLLALLLAAVGNYGVLAYSVNQRRNEIGIRIAMGAEGKSIVWMVAGR